MPATAEPAGNQPETQAQRAQAERVVLPAENFDALVARLDQPGRYDPRVARILSRKAPWE